jgi:hypothetical protein
MRAASSAYDKLPANACCHGIAEKAARMIAADRARPTNGPTIAAAINAVCSTASIALTRSRGAFAVVRKAEAHPG